MNINYTITLITLYFSLDIILALPIISIFNFMDFKNIIVLPTFIIIDFRVYYNSREFSYSYGLFAHFSIYR